MVCSFYRKIKLTDVLLFRQDMGRKIPNLKRAIQGFVSCIELQVINSKFSVSSIVNYLWFPRILICKKIKVFLYTLMLLCFSPLHACVVYDDLAAIPLKTY